VVAQVEYRTFRDFVDGARSSLPLELLAVLAPRRKQQN
jgi:hypothetical protein